MGDEYELLVVEYELSSNECEFLGDKYELPVVEYGLLVVEYGLLGVLFGTVCRGCGFEFCEFVGGRCIGWTRLTGPALGLWYR